MRKPLNILFYENGDPMDCRCIERFLSAFAKGYWKVVREVIKRTHDGLGEKTFRANVAELLPAFKMTRAGAFQGIKIDKTGKLKGDDDFHVVDLCWKSIGDELCSLKRYMDKKVLSTRSRVLVELSPEAEEHVIKTTSRLFEQLSDITVRNKRGGHSQVGSVAASKILFSVLPEIALPVDTSEWKNVFCTKDYSEVLSTMVSEIKEWEKASKKRLDEQDRNQMTTLPAIYNVLAMSTRPL
jgi:hypothetical protein